VSNAANDEYDRGLIAMVEVACNQEAPERLAPDGGLQALLLKEPERIEMIFLGGPAGGEQPWTAEETQRMPLPEQSSAFAINQ
jgi:hypothetical protein